jgi:cytochrome c biogenesis protein CcmG, thiol:disulfide interchange protein DsbE
VNDDESAPPPPRRRRIPWARIVVSVVVLGAAAAIAIGLANRDAPVAVAPLTAPADRRPAPDITLPVLQAAAGVGPDGAPFALERSRGRVVVVNFWAWWCAPCREEIPVLQRASDEYDPEQVLFLGINSEDIEADARRFLRAYPFSYPSLRDSGPDTARAFEIYGYPSTLVIDAEGRVATSYSGAVEDPRQLTEPIDRLLSEG